MSYSLFVYGLRDLGVDRTAGLVGEVTGLRTCRDGGVVQALTVGGGVAFDVNPAVTVYAEDLPDGVDADVTRGHYWTGKEVTSYGREGEWSPSVWSMSARQGPPVGLLGVTSYPTWWVWFGQEYQALLGGWLSRPARRWRVTRGEGVLVELADQPRTRSQLEGPLGRVFGSGWVPSAYVSRKSRPAKIRLDG